MDLCSHPIHDPMLPGRVARRLNVTGEELREIFERVLPVETIEQLATEMGVVERDRKVNIVRLVLSLIVTAGTPSGGLQADALRNYLRMDVAPIDRSSFYKRFTEKLEKLMARLSEDALAYCREQKVDLPGVLGGVIDWLAVDSETAKVRRALLPDYPGTGDYAAIKVHKTLSIGTGCPVAYHFSPAREHDSPHLVIDESWRGYGFLGDLGYASIDRLRACQEHGVAFVIRLKENWKPKVDYIARGTVKKTFFAGTDLDALIEEDVLILDGKTIDCDVTIGPPGRQVQVRLVGIDTPKGYCFFLTNLPAKVGPVQVGTIYRIRWEIELSMKLDKSVHRLDESAAEKPCSLKTLLHASLIASILTALVVHRHHLDTRPKGNRSRTVAPLHPMLVARLFAEEHRNISRALLTDFLDKDELWQEIANILLILGSDPNWRRRPSTLDQLRGSKRLPTKNKAKKRSGKQASA